MLMEVVPGGGGPPLTAKLLQEGCVYTVWLCWSSLLGVHIPSVSLVGFQSACMLDLGSTVIAQSMSHPSKLSLGAYK